jgi:hypothetical protein
VGMLESPHSIEERYAMTFTNVFQLSQPGNFVHPVAEVLRVGGSHLVGSSSNWFFTENHLTGSWIHIANR